MSEQWPERPRRTGVHFVGPLDVTPPGVQDGDTLRTEDGARYVWREGAWCRVGLRWRS